MDFQTEPVVVVPIPEGCRLVVKGPIHTNTAWLEGEFSKALRSEPKLVELDLSETRHVSSAGMGVLIELRKGVKKYGGTLKIVAIQKPVYEALAFAALTAVLNIDPASIVPAKP